MTNKEYEEKFKKITEEMANLSLAKHSDYGDNLVFRYGMKMRFADIWRKYARLEALMWDGKDQKVIEESLRDTLMDLANYCVIAMILYDLERGK